MEDAVDYQAIAQQLQRELEDARIALLSIRQARTLPVDIASIRQFLIKNYVVIMAGTSILFVVFALISTVKSFFTENKE